MNKVLSAIPAALLFVAGGLVSTAPASAANFGDRDQFIGNFCSTHPGASRCDDWRRNRGHWRDSDYRNFYRFHSNDFGTGAAALFGFAAGAAIAGSAANARNQDLYDDGPVADDSDHVAACEDAYRSYDVESDTYLGFDGIRHQCVL